MSHKSFNVNDRVIMIERGEIYKGTIHNVYEALNIAVVKFDDGEYEKVSLDSLAREPETKVREEKSIKSTDDINKIIEETEITLVGKDFMKVVVENARDIAGDNFEVKCVLLMFGAKLHKALFYDAVKK